jgi:hypothetical protein
MILSNELRIGNYLIKNEHWVSVDAPAILDISRLPGEEELYTPIILTSGVLDKCGFRNSCLRVSNDVGWAFQLEVVNGEMVLAVKEYALPLGTKYLHQLQNLFYAITGQELSVAVD